MQSVVISILTSEFFWGVLIGIALTTIGAYVQVKVSSREALKFQRETVRDFAADTVRNIIEISGEIEEARRRSRVIHHDLLALMDVEVNVFIRNREHMIRLEDSVRGEVRRYITRCNLRRVEVAQHLAIFDDQMKLSRQLRANGDTMQAETREAAAVTGPLSEAHRATNDLISTAKGGAEILRKLETN
ncbi:MAG TPA: hypothetical protein VMM55_05795 [Thermohalobaculum sp.]|nr:hypothetical protein [Thermohalobaculum sp.]